MKRLLSVFLVLLLILSLCACEEEGFSPETSLSTEETTVPGTSLSTEPEAESPSAPTLPEQTDPQEDPRPHPDYTPVTPSQPTDPTQPSQPAVPQPDYTPVTPSQPTDPTQPSQPVESQPDETEPDETEPAPYLDPSGRYKTKDEVALYIHLYGKLPSNYITKTQAKSQYGGISKIPGTMNIGGDRFYNREGLLPAGHTYYECDIGTSGGNSRGRKRIVFSSDGLVYYTSDHYESFTQLY